MQIGTSTLGFLYRATLGEALGTIAGLGYETFELACTAPHLDAARAGAFDRFDLKRLIRRLGLRCVTVNPIDINPVAPSPELAELAYRQIRACLDLAHELEASIVAFSPGRRHPLIPCPLEDAHAALHAQFERLLPDAERLGIVLAVETVPYGLLQTGREAAEVVEPFDASRVGVAYDPANTIAFEVPSPAAGLRDLGRRLRVVHISGSWRSRWAHTTVREGEIDHAEVGAALRDLKFSGPTLYELADGDDPEPRLRDDLELLANWGWTQRST
jgi:sugar phosphate isomerase/epimerase